MEEGEDSRNDFMQRLKSNSSTAATTSSIPIPKPTRLDLAGFGSAQVRGGHFRHLPPSPDASKRLGIPPAHPHFSPSAPFPQIPAARSPSAAAANANHSFIHTRSLSQPAFFNMEALSQLTTPSPPPSDVSMEDPPLARTNSGGGSGRTAGDVLLPPRKAHRRSQSDIPFGLTALPPLPHPAGFPSHIVSPRDAFGAGKHGNSLFVKQEADWDRENDGSAERRSESDAGDDLFSAYMNLESLDNLNSSGTEEKREESRASASGNKTSNTGADSSENEAESSVNESGSSSLQLKKEGNKRMAGDLVGVNMAASRHNRSLSMDSFMGKLHFGEESPKLLCSAGPQTGQHSRSGSLDGVTNAFSLEFGNGEFSGAELKKIMANEKLAEIAMADPKRVKRILANRQSAARSKERKMRYISELEHKVQTLQSEATTLSAQLTLLQRDSTGLTSQNNELKFRLQAMEQQAQLRDALNEALSAEVHRLKLVTGEAQLANSLSQQMQLNPQMFPMQQMQNPQQQSSQIRHYQMQPQQQQQQSQQDHHQQQQQQQHKNSDVSKHDSK